MAFLSPLFLLGMLGAAIPIAMHLIGRKTERVIPFAAMRYLREASVERTRRRRVRQLVLLVLRVTALLLLAIAFARPYLAPAAGREAATLVLVDVSASLSAPGQFARARALALDAIAAAPAAHAVGVAAFASSVDVVAPLSLDRAAARAAVEALRPGAGATNYRAALARAADLLGGRSGRIVVVTDLQQTGWDAGDPGGVPARVDVEIRAVAPPARNVAVASLEAGADGVTAAIRNFSDAPAVEQVAFALDGQPLGTLSIDLPAGGAAEARIPLAESSGALTATVTDTVGYAADNVRYTVLGEPGGPVVVGITGSGREADAFYLERAVAVQEGPDAFRFRVLDGEALSGLDAEALSDAGVLVVLGTRGLDPTGWRLLAGFVRRGGGLLVAAGPDVDDAVLEGAGLQTTWRPRAGAPSGFAPVDPRHPVFRPLGGVGTLGQISFSGAVALEPPQHAAVLARFADGTPALVEERAGEGRVLVFASDVNHEWNDLPLQPAFVPFVHEALRYLAGSSPAGREYFAGDLPDAPVPGFVERPSIGAGASDRQVRRVAVNVNPREFDPAPMSPEAFASGLAPLHAAAERHEAQAAREREDGQRLWQLALAAMLAGLTAEGLVARRAG